jgi:hypothetical protein
MLSREEVDRRLESNAKLLADPGILIGERAVLKWEREALETARQLGEWIEATAGESDGVPGCECSWCQSQRACKAWLRGEGQDAS